MKYFPVMILFETIFLKKRTELVARKGEDFEPLITVFISDFGQLGIVFFGLWEKESG
jgi:hypothetical protein